MPDNTMNTKIGYGAKDKLEQAITDGKIDSGDIVFTSDTKEAAFIQPDGTPQYVKSRSTKEYTLNGTDLGRLKDGETVPTDIDMDDLLDIITRKPIHPEYVKPTVTIANDNNGATAGTYEYEAGTTIQPYFVGTFTQNDSKGLTKLTLVRDNTTNISGSTMSPMVALDNDFVLEDKNVTYNVKAEYQEAIDKTNNLDEVDRTNAFAAGTIISENYTFVGKRYSFSGTGVGDLPAIDSDFIRGLNKVTLGPVNGNIIEIPVAVGQQYIVFAYPASIRDVSKVKYEESNDNTMAESFTKHIVDVADARGGSEGLMSYKVYTYQMDSPAEAAMNFTVTI